MSKPLVEQKKLSEKINALAGQKLEEKEIEQFIEEIPSASFVTRDKKTPFEQMRSLHAAARNLEAEISQIERNQKQLIGKGLLGHNDKSRHNEKVISQALITLHDRITTYWSTFGIVYDNSSADRKTAAQKIRILETAEKALIQIVSNIELENKDRADKKSKPGQESPEQKSIATINGKIDEIDREIYISKLSIMRNLESPTLQITVAQLEEAIKAGNYEAIVEIMKKWDQNLESYFTSLAEDEKDSKSKTQAIVDKSPDVTKQFDLIVARYDLIHRSLPAKPIRVDEKKSRGSVLGELKQQIDVELEETFGLHTFARQIAIGNKTCDQMVDKITEYFDQLKYKSTESELSMSERAFIVQQAKYFKNSLKLIADNAPNAVAKRMIDLTGGNVAKCEELYHNLDVLVNDSIKILATQYKPEKAAKRSDLGSIEEFNVENIKQTFISQFSWIRTAPAEMILAGDDAAKQSLVLRSLSENIRAIDLSKLEKQISSYLKTAPGERDEFPNAKQMESAMFLSVARIELEELLKLSVITDGAKSPDITITEFLKSAKRLCDMIPGDMPKETVEAINRLIEADKLGEYKKPAAADAVAPEPEHEDQPGLSYIHTLRMPIVLSDGSSVDGKDRKSPQAATQDYNEIEELSEILKLAKKQRMDQQSQEEKKKRNEARTKSPGSISPTSGISLSPDRLQER